MSPTVATARTIDRAELLDFLRPRHRGLLATTRRDGRPQLSPVTCGVDPDGRIVVSTYPDRAKTRNARRDPRVSIVVQSDDWSGEYVQVDGAAEVLDMPDALCGTEMIVSGAGSKLTKLQDRGNKTFWQDVTSVGFLYIDIQGNKLTGTFIDGNGKVEYTRTITKP